MEKDESLNSQSQRTKGADAQNSNIEAAKAVSEIVKSTLGPMGMDKMLIDSMGNTVITNDGVKILKEMDVEHPGGKILVDVAKTQESEVGDGTTSAVILAGELLTQAQNLLKQNIHPTIIIKTYNEAANIALKALDDNSIDIDTEDKQILSKISQTAMTGKVAEHSKEKLSEILFNVVSMIRENNNINKNRIKIVKIPGENIEDSKLIFGVVIDRKLCNPNMPKKIIDPKILLIDFPLEVKELEAQASVNINSVAEYEQFVMHEKQYLKSVAEKIKRIGANVVICQKGIDDEVAYYLAQEGISAVRRSRRSDLEKLSYSLNAAIVSSEDDIKSERLGSAKLFYERIINDEEFIFIEGCENPKAITLLLKASTKHVLDELERAIEDALGDLNSILKSKKIVAGGGAVELELYKELMKHAAQVNGKKQIIFKTYAESFLIIPKVLCKNAGLDEIDTIANLTANHEKDKKFYGLNADFGVCENTMKEGIIEPVNVKVQAIKSATESCNMILRIDDIIAAKKLNEDELLKNI
jgi:thermosome